MKNKTLLKRIVCIISILLAFFTAGAFYLQWFALNASGNKRGKNISESYAFMKERYPQLRTWTDSLKQHGALRDTFITATDGTRLHALYLFASPSTLKTAVVVHGYTDNAVRMLHIAYMYNHDLHYNVLIPDLRFSGQSDGSHLQLGWQDRLDVLRWMDVANHIFSSAYKPPITLIKEQPNRPISQTSPQKNETQMVVHGISMGGATTMCVSGELQKTYVKCFVNDCGFTSVWDEFGGELKAQFGLPKFPLLYLASLLTEIRYGWNFKEASPLQQVKKCKHPMLFIHGDADAFVPVWMGDSLYAAKKGEKEYWKSPGVAHAESYLKFPEKYTEKVKSFIEKYIK